jgi:hypothetical protein
MRLRGCKGLELDGQYLCQLEDMARFVRAWGVASHVVNNTTADD